MRATEFIIDNVEEKLKNVPTKPRNFVAKNAMKTTSGAGAHRDKKKEQKQGDFKHKNQDVEEGSKENDPFEQGWRTFFRRGDESDNPYEKGSPEYAQWLNGFQEGEAQPNHYESVAVSEKAPPGEKAERMVKHIKKGYAKDGKLTDKERSIAYATAWKHHNK